MNIPFNTQLLGDLIEKGYKYMLCSTTLPDYNGSLPVILKPVKTLPSLQNLPEGYQTYYRITREPLQMACGIDSAKILLEYGSKNETLTTDDVYNDSYFRMSDDFFKQVLESLEDYAVITTDTNGDINSWNTGAEKVLGYHEQEILGTNAAIFFTPEDVEKGIDKMELETALREGRAIDERYHVRRDRSRFWGTGLVFPLFDEEKKHRGFTKIMRNLREEEQAREDRP
ncbi:MAG: PAS domain S-box protein [Sphingobacteriaceae bacterium]|nr:MAG: PAS domain S-box protein [Sphingobacteriaceae bacterium]